MPSSTVALPSIHRGLGTSSSDLQGVSDAYALTLAGLLLAAGSLADRVGRRRVFALGLTVFTSSSFMAGIALSPLWLHLARRPGFVPEGCRWMGYT
jgi:MFS family permease